MEPFVGSGAVLLARPTPPRIETINDVDAYLCCVWRALKHDPEGVAYWADDVVSEADLHARHRWLVGVEEPEPLVPERFARHPLLREAYLAGFRGKYPTYGAAFRQRMRRDPHYYDAKVAGWWLHGACCWIGGGWCHAPEDGPGNGPHGGSGERRTRLTSAYGFGDVGVHARGGAPAAGGLPQKVPKAPRPTGNNVGGNSIGVHAEKPAEAFADSHRPPPADASAPGRGAHAGPQGGDRVPGLREKVPMIGGGDHHYGCGVHGKAGDAGPQGGEGPAGWEQVPHLGGNKDHGRGVHAGPGGGLSEALPNIGGYDGYAVERGVHAKHDGGKGEGQGTASWVRDYPGGTCAARRAWLLDWFGRLRDRLRCVRVCCGHWKRVCDSESVTTRLGQTGIFLDCPYRTHLADGSVNRAGGLYGSDGKDTNALVDEVIAYCVERGGNPKLRIAACCYEGEGYEVLARHGWTVVAYKASGGYGNRSAKGKHNATRERIWFSPHCNRDKSLFDGLEDVRPGS